MSDIGGVENVMVDKYQLFLEGSEYVIIYICPYGHSSSYVPKVDVKETKDVYVLDMELPGRSENDVNIELDHNTLTISSKIEETKESKEDKKSEKWLIKERRCSSFRRSFTIPEDVNSEEVKASFKNGILSVEMPRKALPTPKKITINVA
jgi:HSP20 family protein